MTLYRAVITQSGAPVLVDTQRCADLHQLQRWCESVALVGTGLPRHVALRLTDPLQRAAALPYQRSLESWHVTLTVEQIPDSLRLPAPAAPRSAPAMRRPVRTARLAPPAAQLPAIRRQQAAANRALLALQALRHAH